MIYGVIRKQERSFFVVISLLTVHQEKEKKNSFGYLREILQKQVLESVEKLYGIADPYIVGEDFESIAELTAEVMHSSKKTLAVAESCTGGTIAAKLTAIPGASSYFKGGIVSYCNEAKENILGVSHEILEQFGAVSEATAREMAIGAMQKLDSDYAIATTGVAGPSGGTSEIPVGTVFIAVASHHECRIFEKHFPGKREQIIERAQNTAYVALIRLVREEILKF